MSNADYSPSTIVYTCQIISSMDDSKKSMQKLFGSILRKHRLAAGLSQQELALNSGFDRTYISLLERGLRAPSLYTIMILCDHLKVQASDQIRELEAKYESQR